MNKFKINIVFSEAELDIEATVANFATVQKQFNMHWSQFATSRETGENYRFQNDASNEHVCYGNDC